MGTGVRQTFCLPSGKRGTLRRRPCVPEPPWCDLFNNDPTYPAWEDENFAVLDEGSGKPAFTRPHSRSLLRGGQPPAAEMLLVSIGLPVYERYLRQALDSLLGQEYRNFELIVSDNASTDATEQICRDY